MGGDRRAFTTRTVLLFTAACAGVLFSPAAMADVAPPNRFAVDENGVDLTRGTYSGRTKMLSIGSGPSELSVYLDHAQGYNQPSEYELGVYGDQNSVDVAVPDSGGQRSVSFSKTGAGIWQSRLGDGATLTLSGALYLLRLADGSEFTYDAALTSSDSSRIARVTKIKYATGELITITYARQVGCSSSQQAQCQGSAYPWKVRVQAVSSSSGYQLRYEYFTGIAGDYRWNDLTKITAFNTAVDACLPTSATCNFSRNWPSLTFTPGPSSLSARPASWSITDALGRTTAFTATTIRYAGSISDDLTVKRTNGRVSSIVSKGREWQYSFDGSTTVTNPDATKRTVASDPIVGLPLRVVDESGATISYTFDIMKRLTTATAPTGMQQRFSYDDRGNVTEVRTVSATPGSPPDIVLTTGFDAVCSNSITCNQPNWTRDAKGDQTDYTYDPNHGGLLTVTSPAGANGVRPQTRISYRAFEAYFKNGAGIITASGSPTYLPTEVSQCRTASTCSGSVDETRKTITYGEPGVANNLLPTSVSIAAGDGIIVSKTTRAYDPVGNVAFVDGPSIGSADTTRIIHDTAGQVVGIIGPDPDGTGLRRPLARRILYNTRGQRTEEQFGTVADQSDSAWAIFLEEFRQSWSYDSKDQVARTSVTAGKTYFSLTDFLYDSAGRPSCSIQYMSPSSSIPLPTLCTPSQTTGANGPDRVMKTAYDPSRRIISKISAADTVDQSEEQEQYSATGKSISIKDANGNVTTSSYDGFDRLLKTTFADGSYEQIGVDGQNGYDSSGNVTLRRLRDGQTSRFVYDALSRLVSKDRPNDIYWETDQSYAYDNAGNLTQASDSNGRVLNFGYDALGRKTSQTDNWYSSGNTSTLYDPNGQALRTTWGDGTIFNYDYRTTGEIKGIRDGAGTALIAIDYDDLARRTSLTRANGTVTSYAYDSVSRISQLTQDLAGVNGDLTVNFRYNAASQITSRISSNNAYAWTGAYNVARSYSVNALNQLTSAGGNALGYDGRGNLNSSGGAAYGYKTDNQLATAFGVGLAYDALGRLFNVNSEKGVNVTLISDGENVIAELDQSTGRLLRRYVYGPGNDEPLIWYEGASFDDRRWLHADERGSIVALTNDAGEVMHINSYDEYGIPDNNNVGRFQYTGQKWLPSVGLYDYKARSYSPTLGRFMQTDPVGYADGVNWYNYVGADPINRKDPTGLGYVDTNGDIVVVGSRPSTPGGSSQDYGGNPGWFRPYIPTVADVWSYKRMGLLPTARGQAPQKGKLPKCQFHAPHLSLQFDAGIFAGYGGGFTLGVDIDFQSGAVTPFKSFRSGQGLGLTVGLGLGLSNSGPTAGTSSSRNASIGIGPAGAGISRPSGGGPASINAGGSIGPKLGFELSKTETLTSTADISAKSEALCQ